ncbi:MAG: cytochrome C [Deltaproteobacteria bacterium]|nr:cytochrome C [Candidatus Anaeroferrophillus wilburensis]MBN2887880.1 cytochrome C [Deltaproteobacteria bacterium]
MNYKKNLCLTVAAALGLVLILSSPVMAAEEICIACHEKVSPGQVADWRTSRHAGEDVTCSTCHGDKHQNADDGHLAQLPSEQVCAECHEEQFGQFSHGKHNFGWTSLNAMPITHVEPDELMEGGRGCGGCHNMGIKSDAQKQEQLDKGYRYQNNSCDECHTRHSFSKKEAQDPRACQQCHMGYDHPQWEMWSSSKHGSRWFAKEAGRLDKNAPAPTCQNCHMPDGNHNNHTAWGFLGVRLPLPKDRQWAADQVTILKALGVLNPETGEPTVRLEAVKAVDLARLTQEAWETEREKMIKTCTQCHAEQYARRQLEMGDTMLMKADRLLAEAIEVVAGLYKDGTIKKHDNYAFAYPDFLYFMRTGGGNLDQATFIEQVLFQMYMKHRMRTYQAHFHVNPDYAYWYGWAMMTKDLVEIKELAHTMRATHK